MTKGSNVRCSLKPHYWAKTKANGYRFTRSFSQGVVVFSDSREDPEIDAFDDGRSPLDQPNPLHELALKAMPGCPWPFANHAAGPRDNTSGSYAYRCDRPIVGPHGWEDARPNW